MDFEYALGWLVGTSTLVGLVITLYHYRIRVPGWLAVYGVVLGIVLLNVVTDLPHLGYVAGGVWGLLLLAPLTALRKAQEALQQGKWNRAVAWSRIAGALHPWDGVRSQSQHLSYGWLVQLGRFEAARRALEPLLHCRDWAERAKLELFRLEDDWQGIFEHVSRQEVGKRDLRIAPVYLRALGELGKLDAMWQLYAALPPPLRALPLLRLQMASLTGLESCTAQLLSRAPGQVTADEAELWRAIAAQRAGDHAAAEERLRPLSSSSAGVGRAAALKLRDPLEPQEISALSTKVQTAIQDFQTRLQACLAAPPARNVPFTPRATWGLAILLLAVFVLGIPGGSMDLQNLIRMGALVLPAELVGGEVVSRVVRAGFLHFGGVHLGLNLVGLVALGRDVERLYGARGVVLAFLGISVASFGSTAIWTTATVDQPQILLGASAGVMGFVGVLIAHSAVGFLRGKNRQLGRRLLLLGAVVLGQVVFDSVTPLVSGRLHLTGALLGALIGLPLAWHRWRPRT